MTILWSNELFSEVFDFAGFNYGSDNSFLNMLQFRQIMGNLGHFCRGIVF